VSGLLGAGLWLGLQYGAGYDPATAAALGIGLWTLLGTLGAAWSQLPVEAPRGLEAAASSSDLERVTGTFADRANEWAEIKELALGVRDGGSEHLVVLIHGMPGTGKSEFALHAAHRLAEEFADYARREKLTVLARRVKLYGTAGVSPTDLRDALRRQLDPRGENPQLAKMDLADLAAEWRKYLHGKLLILVLDNVRDEAQVEPFLPGASPGVVLVTGRRMLQGLLASGVRSFPLRVLGPAGAIDMVKNIIGPRIVSEDSEKAIAEIARLCDYLPLAIRLAAQPLAGRPGLSVARQQELLAGQPDRLSALDRHAAQGPGGSECVVRAFDLSYGQLTDNARLLLRRLSLAPVPDLGVAAATVLADLRRDIVRACLEELALESLITEEDDGGQHYTIHDLLKEYGRSLARDDDPAANEAAVARLLGYYSHAAAQVDRLLTRQPPPEAIRRQAPAVSEVLPDLVDAVRWARAELPNLLACADYAVREAGRTGRREDHAWVITFATVLAGILRNEGRWRRSIDLQTDAAESARLIGLPLAEANALAERGLLRRLTTEPNESAADLVRAIGVYQQAGGAAGRAGEAHARNTYAVVLDQLHRPDEASQELTAALDLHRAANDPLGEANVLHDQGMASFFRENYAEAARLTGQALTLYRSVDHPLGLAHAHSNLARVQQHTGDEKAAAANLEAAQRLYRDLGNRLGEINVLVRLGQMLGRDQRKRAVQTLTQAATFSRDIGNHLTEVDALNALGDVQQAAGNSRKAVAAWTRALTIAREHGIEREATKLVAKIGRGR